MEFHSCRIRGDVLSHCTLELQEISSSSLFLPNSAHSPAVPVCAVTFYFDRGHMQPSFSRLGAQLCTTRQKISWIVQVFMVCKVEAFVSIKTSWLSGASVRNSPAESTLPLPSLYHFELLRIFVSRMLENGQVFRFPVVKNCLRK